MWHCSILDRLLWRVRAASHHSLVKVIAEITDPEEVMKSLQHLV